MRFFTFIIGAIVWGTGLSITLSSSLGQAAPAAELTLSPALTQELNKVLKTSDDLHRALLSQDEEQIEIGIRDVLRQLELAKGVALTDAKPHERAHLDRILDAAHEYFNLTRSSFGQERRTRLEDGFNQLVNLVRIYRLDHSYSIFFCPKDKTNWVQKGDHAKNPFHAEAGNREPCGMKVPH